MAPAAPYPDQATGGPHGPTPGVRTRDFSGAWDTSPSVEGPMGRMNPGYNHNVVSTEGQWARGELPDLGYTDVWTGEANGADDPEVINVLIDDLFKSSPEITEAIRLSVALTLSECLTPPEPDAVAKNASEPQEEPRAGPMTMFSLAKAIRSARM